MLFEGSYSDYILVQGRLIEKKNMAYNKTNTYYKGSADMSSVLSLFNMVSFVCGPPCIYILFSNQLNYSTGVGTSF